MAWSTVSRHKRGYGVLWERLRARILKRDSYLCQPCKRKGRVTQATQVDHIKPKAKGGTDDEGNCQSICADCHLEKTATEDRRYPSKRMKRADGWTP